MSVLAAVGVMVGGSLVLGEILTLGIWLYIKRWEDDQC